MYCNLFTLAFQTALRPLLPQMPPRCLPDAFQMAPSSSLICDVSKVPRLGTAPFESFAIFDAQKKVSELSVKCVFGLHRRERIASAIFQKRLQNVTLKKWFFSQFFGSFLTWAQEGQTDHCRVPKGAPRGATEVLVGSSRLQHVCRERLLASQMCHKRGCWRAMLASQRRKA